jgi:hypothetical protein
MKKKESSFSEEKEAKRLLFLALSQDPNSHRNKSLFASFSSEKEDFFF